MQLLPATMNIKISEDIVNNTTECTKDFSCLNPDAQRDICKILACLKNNLYFIKCLNEDYCSYRMSFGADFLCMCPVRKDIYNRYRI